MSTKSPILSNLRRINHASPMIYLSSSRKSTIFQNLLSPCCTSTRTSITKTTAAKSCKKCHLHFAARKTDITHILECFPISKTQRSKYSSNRPFPTKNTKQRNPRWSTQNSRSQWMRHSNTTNMRCRTIGFWRVRCVRKVGFICLRVRASPNSANCTSSPK